MTMDAGADVADAPREGGAGCTGVQASCAAIHACDPTRASGNYMIAPDGPTDAAPVLVFCDMAIGGGGWTVIYLADNINLNSTTIPYTVTSQKLRDNSTQALIAFRNLNLNMVASDTAVFDLPAAWRTSNPLTATPPQDLTVSASVNGGLPALAKLRYGVANFGSLCGDDWNTTTNYGRVCLQDTAAAFYSGFSTPGRHHRLLRHQHGGVQLARLLRHDPLQHRRTLMPAGRSRAVVIAASLARMDSSEPPGALRCHSDRTQTPEAPMTAEHALEVQTVFRGVVIGTKYVLPPSRHHSVRSRRHARRCTFAIGSSAQADAPVAPAFLRHLAEDQRGVTHPLITAAGLDGDGVRDAAGDDAALRDHAGAGHERRDLRRHAHARAAHGARRRHPRPAHRARAPRARAPGLRRGHVPGCARGARGGGAGGALLVERNREPLSRRHRARRGDAAAAAHDDASRSARAGARRLRDRSRHGELRDQTAGGAGAARAPCPAPARRSPRAVRPPRGRRAPRAARPRASATAAWRSRATPRRCAWRKRRSRSTSAISACSGFSRARTRRDRSSSAPRRWDRTARTCSAT